jgi:hypothetical protein
MRGLAFGIAEPVNCLPARVPQWDSGLLSGGRFPLDTVHGRYAARAHGLAPRPRAERTACRA